MTQKGLTQLHRSTRFLLLWAMSKPPAYLKLSYLLGILALGVPQATLAQSTQRPGSQSDPLQPAPAIDRQPTIPTPTQRRSEDEERRMRLPSNPSGVRIGSTRQLTLREALLLAERSNRELEVARLGIARSETSLREAKAAEALRVGVSGSLRQDGTPILTNPDRTAGTSAQGSVEATYDLDASGRNRNRIDAAQRQLEFDRLEIDRVRAKVQNDVILAYYDLQEADEQVKISDEDIRQAERSLRDAKLQEQAGLGTRFDVLQAESQRANANQDSIRNRAQQAIARKRLAQTIGLNDTTEYRSADIVREAGEWRMSLEDSIIAAYRARPELKQEIVRRGISEQLANAAAADNAAQVNLFGRYDLARQFSISQGFRDGFAVGAQVRWDFADGGASSARADRERVSQTIATTNFENARNQIRLQVERSYLQLKSSQENIQTATVSIRQTEEALRLARLRFQAGVGTQTDVIIAQTNLTRARGNRLRAVVEYNRAYANLRTAVFVQP